MSTSLIYCALLGGLVYILSINSFGDVLRSVKMTHVFPTPVGCDVDERSN